jgi:hypothetical protein
LMLVTAADNPRPWFWQREKRRAWRAARNAERNTTTAGLNPAE